MNSVLIVTGPREIFGSGHEVRMHALALALKARKITVQHVTLMPDAPILVPLEYNLTILDRRDTGFNPLPPGKTTFRVAIDNRGAGRDEADAILDLLPHFAMNNVEYREALGQVILRSEIAQSACASASAAVSLHDSPEEAALVTDFLPSNHRVSPHAFSEALRKSRKPALYFGQSLFEAVYLGLHVQLYPVSEYHRKLSVDLVSRMLIDPQLLQAIDGLGVRRVADKLIALLKHKL